MPRCAQRRAGVLLGFSWALALAACDSESNPPGDSLGTSGSSGDAGGGAAGAGSAGMAGSGAGSAGVASGGAATGGSATGGSSALGGSGGNAGGGGAATVAPGQPHVFVGSTDGNLRAFTVNPSDGSLTPAGNIDAGQDLDFIALGPDDATLFVSLGASVAAYEYDREARSFTPSGDAPTGGAGTHVAVDASGNYVFVAHYNEGELSFFSYSSDGGFGAGETFTPGQNAHQVRVDPSGLHVYVPCLGSNHVAQYILEPGSGSLSASAPANVAASGGPRHMDFNPDATRAYVLTENSSQIHVYDINASTGVMSARPADSEYLSVDQQYHWSSDVHVTPDGRFLYAANRDPSELVRFEIATGGGLSRLGATPLGAVVRAFAVDTRGEYLYVGGDDGNLVAFRVDAATGGLSSMATTSGLGNIRATVARELR
jgi:6-phosphogluconolactonase